MRHHRLSRFALLAAAALPALLLAGTARAEDVRIFENAPSLEQLRSIMIPESNGALSRRIVLPHANTLPKSSVQPAAAQMPVAPAPVAPRPQPEPAAAQVADPAPAPAPAPAASEEAPAPKAGVVGFRINFAFNSDVIPDDGRAFVERIGELMQAEPQLAIRIEGHTDAVGSDAYNLDLSKRRALAVALYLVNNLGISEDRLAVVGKGKTEPLTDDPYDAANRRVQFARIQ